MVSLDSVDNILVLTILGSDVNTELNVRSVDLCGHSLTDVVKKTCASCHSNINAHLLGDNACEHGNLNRVAKRVLTVRGTVLHATKELDKLGMKAVNAGLEYRLLTRLLNCGINVAASLLNHLLNSCGMDSAVANQLLKCDSRDLAAHGIKAGNGDNVGRIVDDKLHAGEILDGTDVTALTTDDTSLHIVTGNGYNGNCDLADVVCGTTLNSERENVLRLSVGLLLKALLILCDLECGLVLHLAVKSCNELCLCILAGETCNLLKHCKLSLKGLCDLCLDLVRICDLLCENSLLALDALELCVKSLFLLGNSTLQTGYLFTTFLNVKVCFLLELEDLFLCCNYGLFLLVFSILDSFLKNMLSLFLCRAELLLCRKLTYNDAHSETNGNGSNYGANKQTNMDFEHFYTSLRLLL